MPPKFGVKGSFGKTDLIALVIIAIMAFITVIILYTITVYKYRTGDRNEIQHSEAVTTSQQTSQE
jgi:heme/copper-type cytochrome/quinol oxidase subunit 2